MLIGSKGKNYSRLTIGHVFGRCVLKQALFNDQPVTVAWKLNGKTDTLPASSLSFVVAVPTSSFGTSEVLDVFYPALHTTLTSFLPVNTRVGHGFHSDCAFPPL